MAKIVLIQPPSPYLKIQRWDLPLCLMYLRGYLQKQGHKVKIQNLEGITNYLGAIDLDADIYGVTIFTPQHSLAIEIGNYIKSKTKALLVAGGHHVSAIPYEFLNASPYDIVVRGEGEFTMAEICAGVALEQIKGISYKRKGEIVSNPDREFFKDIDVIPFPTIDDINLEEYGRVYINKPHSKYSMDVMTSRGCPRACAFCASSSFWKRRVRFHSVEYVFEYLDYLHDRGINDFVFIDDNFVLKRSRLEIICEKLKSMGSVWGCSTRSDCVTPELAKLLKDSGCQKVCLGIETGSNRLLDLMYKQTTVEKHANAAHILKDVGLTVLGFLIVGLPSETEEDVRMTMKFIKEQPVDYYTISTFVPYPGTPIWRNPENYGYAFDKSRPYDEYCTLSKDFDVKAIGYDYEKVNRHRRMLVSALQEKCTNISSLKKEKLIQVS